ncbi:uncharacterized protein A4U43_C08F9300 [Asparagus officinalis]|uniref:glucan endo-1,3-beta-glucosidase 4-like n=1 Tax=Asparagus officinalis TaxID=4686 RepID=UPI00098E786F|nr:glucan endo-1,3-beta-glucosidase 4-like [Asparagus officinalis]ONK59686.1 uncharacterized protein A4U43_C08F9300 [Asparagus officinalis]
MLQMTRETCLLLLLIFMFSYTSDAHIGIGIGTNISNFNEELRYEIGSGRMMYSLDNFHSVSLAGTGSFCVAVQNADAGALQAGLNWACGPGGANCSAIQPGEPCYSTNLAALASYAYNDYYQRAQATGGTCGFNNTAMLTTNDPSNGACIFTGSSETGTNSTGGGGLPNTNSSSGGGGSGSIIPNPSFGPSGPSAFDNSVSGLQLPKLEYVVVLVILLSLFKI